MVCLALIKYPCFVCLLVRGTDGWDSNQFDVCFNASPSLSWQILVLEIIILLHYHHLSMVYRVANLDDRQVTTTVAAAAPLASAPPASASAPYVSTF